MKHLLREKESNRIPITFSFRLNTWSMTGAGMPEFRLAGLSTATDSVRLVGKSGELIESSYTLMNELEGVYIDIGIPGELKTGANLPGGFYHLEDSGDELKSHSTSTETGDVDVLLEEAKVSQRLNNLQRAYSEKQQRLKRLDGRHHPDGYVASDSAISAASRIMKQLYRRYFVVPHAVNATVDKSVLLEFGRDSLYDAIEIFEDGSIVHSQLRPDSGIFAEEIKSSDRDGVSRFSQELANVYTPY